MALDRRQLPVRMSPKLHEWLANTAAAEGVSMNELAVRILLDAMIAAEIRAEGERLTVAADGLEKIRDKLAGK